MTDKKSTPRDKDPRDARWDYDLKRWVYPDEEDGPINRRR